MNDDRKKQIEDIKKKYPNHEIKKSDKNQSRWLSVNLGELTVPDILSNGLKKIAYHEGKYYFIVSMNLGLSDEDRKKRMKIKEAAKKEITEKKKAINLEIKNKRNALMGAIRQKNTQEIQNISDNIAKLLIEFEALKAGQ